MMNYKNHFQLDYYTPIITVNKSALKVSTSFGEEYRMLHNEVSRIIDTTLLDKVMGMDSAPFILYPGGPQVAIDKNKIDDIVSIYNKQYQTNYTIPEEVRLYWELT